MRTGELRQFFLSAESGVESPELGGKTFLVLSSRDTQADFLMDGVLFKGWSKDYLTSNSSVISE